MSGARPRVVWVVDAALEHDGGRLTSPLASARYRALIPARYINEHGIDGDVVPLADCAERTPRADVVVLSKNFGPAGLALAERVRSNGAALIADFCDDHFDHPTLGPRHRRLAEIADGVTAATAAMAEVVAARTGRAAEVVGDPFEGPAGAPRFAPAETVRLVWFGSLTNIDSIVMMVPALAPFAAERPLELHFVTAPAPELAAACAQWSRALAPQLRLRLTPWSPAATWAALAEADLVLLPTNSHAAGGPNKTVKSPNRMVEALCAGRFALAHPLAAYRELGAYAWVDEDLILGLRWALAHPEVVRTRIAAGQAAVAARFAPEAIAGRWAEVIRHTAASRQPALTGAEP